MENSQNTVADERIPKITTSRRRKCGNAVLVSSAVVATAVIGSLGSKPDTAWFKGLEKPTWYPPAKAFPIAWTALYVTLAWSGTRVLNRTPKGERKKVTRVLGTNLVLNTAWTWTFFRARRPDLALATIVALDVSNLSLIKTFARYDGVAAAAQVPYALWTGFATALTEEIWHANG